MSEVNCANCIVWDFKDSLCEEEFCKKFKCARESKDFIEHVLEVAMPRGEWESLADDNRPLDPRMKCSVCGEIHTPLARWNFCPNCGSDNRKRGETE